MSTRRGRKVAAPVIVVIVVIVVFAVATMNRWPPLEASGGGRSEDVRPITEDVRSGIGVAQQFRTDSIATLAAAALPGELAFDLTNVSSAVELGDGQVVTFSRIDNALLLFDSTGHGQRVLGGRGEGPGQFMRASELLRVAGDTVVLLDAANHRKSWITPDRGVVRSLALTSDYPFRANHAAGVLPDGSVIVTTGGSVHEGVVDSVTRPAAVLYRVDSVGGVEEIGQVADLETIAMVSEIRGVPIQSGRPLAFGLHASVVVWDSLIAIASSSRHAIDLWSAHGEVVGRFGIDRPRRAVTAAMADSAVARELANIDRITEQIADRAGLEREARATPVADSFPPFDRLLVSADGVLWAIDPIAPGDLGWSATGFLPDRSIFASLVSGSPGIPLFIGTGYVLVRVEDEQGIVSIQRYKFGTETGSVSPDPR